VRFCYIRGGSVSAARHTCMLKHLLLTASLAVATASPTQAQAPAAYKRVSFAILEDYDKGADLLVVARDFAAMKTLGVTTWRG